MEEIIVTPANHSAIPEVKKLLEYFASIRGKKLITGQHTQTMAQEELHHIYSVTGKYPALLGFELLSYSPNINYRDTDEECMKEVEENRGTLQRAWEWADRGGLITFTWHWFSPLSGHSKSFFTECTDFNAEQALVPGTKEHRALLSDLDVMAGLLRPFCEAHIPILWRPFHESEGTWFWWSAKGPETAKKLYRLMFERFTGVHELHNLIWVWNSPLKEGYPGDDVVDVISRDMYPAPHEHTARKAEYQELSELTPCIKPVAIAETGVLPDLDAMVSEGVPWVYYMTWSHRYCLSEDFNSYEYLRKLYHHENAVTLERLSRTYTE